MLRKKKDIPTKKTLGQVASRGEKTKKEAPVKKNVEVEDTNEKTPAGFPIVGIGASAGGLAAFGAFFSGMPADTNPNMAFVLVQHLAPDQVRYDEV